ncbi:MAG: ThiF family adenylyltransferase [Marinobacter sp.]|uniref:ThiF family adenylyltransferase n=1 Tax=Marinobacter sp. TaxID=50741 RepID=UPI001B5AE1FB|nr:ThiF family adenylyltransferase [Marinobacter sp.]MBQ0746513.1 ThiF family adenylyltransferase [Marinobacter sp.]MBQ0815681.1 ThiF family adenylyltransferase [Marinobacter sp.]
MSTGLVVEQLATTLASVGAKSVGPILVRNDHIQFCVTKNDDGCAWMLRLEANLPLTQMPDVYLADPSAGAELAHVTYGGKVCYSDHEGEGFDANSAAHVIAFAVSQSLDVLDDAAEKRAADNFQDRLDEFEGYWFSLPNCALVALDALPGDRQLYARVRVTKTGVSILGIDSGISPDMQGTRRKIHFFKLSSPLLPPVNGQDWRQEWLPRLITHAGNEAEEIASQPGSHIFLFQQQRSEGDSFYGITFNSSRRRKGVVTLSKPRPFAIQRSWRDHLLRRTGSTSSKRKVAIIGCGSVGSRVAEQLALAGIDELVLVDPDRMAHDNIYRHVLGRSSVGKYKVEALKQEFEEKRTALRVDAVPGYALDWLKMASNRMGCDTIIMTTGQLALEREITRRAFVEDWPQRLISGWVEPFGLGGHAIESRPRLKGCLECLHTNIEGQASPSNRAAFLEPGQKFSRNLTGCGGAFTPYSSLDATRSAFLVTEMALSDHSGYRCWLGDSARAEAQGLRVTSLYTRLKSGQSDSFPDVAQGGCACCNT